jgi:squalene-hopene/tetraprenyl-beta-curcumene cyclase
LEEISQMKAGIRGAFALLMCIVGATSACSHPAAKVSNPNSSNSWDPKAAAAYLDYREGWWMEWTASARDHGTFCISCHTQLPYALARPALRTALGERGPAENERRLVENVVKRVRLGEAAGPYYGDKGYGHRAGESRETESVLNALVLASHDAQSGRLSDDTRLAFENMWALQQTSGAWLWLQFDQEPWEADDSDFYGATLAAMAVGIAPENYAETPAIQDNLKRLREYLSREGANQSTINRIFLLWASANLPGVISPELRKVIIDEILARQQADGGWRLASISWKWNRWSLKSAVNMWLREDGTPMDGKSDGLATSLATLGLQEAGVPRDSVQLQRGLAWLLNNQNSAEGFWPASSVNKRRHKSSDTGRFMSDAATAFAVLSLTEAQHDVKPAVARVDQRGSSPTN